MNMKSIQANESQGLLLRDHKHSAEVRIPNRLLSCALIQRNTKALRLLSAAKLNGNHRAEIGGILDALKIKPKTGKRLLTKIVQNGWGHTDGTFLFPRSWNKMGYKKRRGLYVTVVPLDLKRFEALCFAQALKKILSRGSSPARSERGRTKQKPDLPFTYLLLALGLKSTRFKQLKAAAQRYGYLKSEPQVKVIGAAQDVPALKKNLHGIPVFKRGKHAVTPDICKIRVLI